MRALAVLALLSIGWDAPAVAQGSTDDRLAEAVRGFVVEEADVSDPDEQAVMADCILDAFEVFDADEKATILAEDDFEDSLDAAVMMRPEIEDTIEGCLG